MATQRAKSSAYSAEQSGKTGQRAIRAGPVRGLGQLLSDRANCGVRPQHVPDGKRCRACHFPTQQLIQVKNSGPEK
jgi:hypothetical protein